MTENVNVDAINPDLAPAPFITTLNNVEDPECEREVEKSDSTQTMPSGNDNGEGDTLVRQLQEKIKNLEETVEILRLGNLANINESDERLKEDEEQNELEKLLGVLLLENKQIKGSIGIFHERNEKLMKTVGFLEGENEKLKKSVQKFREQFDIYKNTKMKFEELKRIQAERISHLEALYDRFYAEKYTIQEQSFTQALSYERQKFNHFLMEREKETKYWKKEAEDAKSKHASEVNKNEFLTILCQRLWKIVNRRSQTNPSREGGISPSSE